MKTIVILSGGMDSATLLYAVKSRGDAVKALSVDYGQRHVRELLAASRICEEAGVEHRVADLTALRPFMSGSSQTDDVPVPEGHYTEESMKATVVPNRNMLLLATAAAWAISSKFNCVAYGAHAGDHAIYPDCRESFIATMREAFLNCDWHPIKLEAPFTGMSKADIAKLGGQLGVPFALTYSCYAGREKHCGRCGTCVERREAFQLSGVPDPTAYEIENVPVSM
jgi:7-cyano-7-deazaguanine synthase